MGGGGEGSAAHLPAISKTVVSMNVKFCRVLETSLNVFEMLKLFTQCLLVYHNNSGFLGKSLDFSQKHQLNSYCCQIHNVKDKILPLS